MSSNRTTPQTPSTTNAPYPLPNPFDGTPGTLQGFLTGTRAYLHFNEDSFENDSDKGKDALMARFYQRLKDEIKNELIKEERPQLLSEYVELAVKIDNRIYERKLEKKEGRGAWTPRPQAANTGRRRWETPQAPRAPRQSTSYGHHSGPMDLSATQHKKPYKDPKSGKCFKCDKAGHIARNCPNNTALIKTHQSRELNAAFKVPQEEHALQTWTRCYEDNCLVHRNSKDDAGWYPRRPKQVRVLAMGRRDTTGVSTSTRHSSHRDHKRTHKKEPLGQVHQVRQWQKNVQKAQQEEEEESYTEEALYNTETTEEDTLDDEGSVEELPPNQYSAARENDPQIYERKKIDPFRDNQSVQFCGVTS
uniref:CCHC-type domain-containing protein n=1 Tax=Pyricularia oryzae (strain P131) TaxID=1143193 RepID=L7J7S3_PYRO1